jgi:hypothetical protein
MNTLKLVEMVKSVGRGRIKIGKKDVTHATRYKRKSYKLIGTGRYEPNPENRVAEDDEPKKTKDIIDTKPKIISFAGQSR